MTIRTTPPISLTDVMDEIRLTNPGRAYPISLGDADVRALAGIPSGPISLSDFYGKSAYPPMTVTATATGSFKNSAASAGTVSGTATASASGGKGAKQYQWIVLSNPGDASISGLNSSQLSASKAFARYSTGSADVQARCNATDETGATVSSNIVTIALNWEYSL